jgi:hypothetical protein
VNEPRQRAVCALVTSAVALGLLMSDAACDLSPSIQTAQTAVAAVQTFVPGAQTALPGLQTALPGLQATAQAGATSVAGVLGDSQAVATQLQALLAGVSIDLQTTPSGVSNDAVTQVTITGTDQRGTLSQMDPSTRQAAASTALLIGGQYFPNATISLSLVDGSGTQLLNGTKAPGQAPSIQ